MNEMAFLKENGLFLKYVADKDKDYVMCATAVFENPRAIQYVPSELVDDVLLEHVIKSGQEYIELIPDGCFSPHAEHLVERMYPHYICDQNFTSLEESEIAVLDQIYKNIGLDPINRQKEE
ncbi:hypothetical protein [Acinetobacter sp. P1(2025)]|uniref:hypothetical protein n=1 Tax=Acinetobacter sp. P1(2025) TaxID=3446120 RepID=UPI003F53DA80